ncbi:MAG TPA: hypothetical protein VGR23_05085 [Candidatus Dormibacteraeota bacterium]|jgi:hypothetical protein|nr:hypothetical protein [Candidatus Dormibacteraeota bacterium]
MATATISHIGRELAIPRENEGFDIPAMARKLWRPMLTMGLMTVAAGVIAGAVQATLDLPLHVSQVAAWDPGVLFLGIGFLLSAVTFLLATIVGELRDGGTSVQQALGAKALILKRPLTGKLFPPVMMMGLMTLIATLAIGFVQAAKLDSDPNGAADIGAWIGPLRFAGVALLFTGVALALATIVRSLRFQAARIEQLSNKHGEG